MESFTFELSSPGGATRLETVQSDSLQSAISMVEVGDWRVTRQVVQQESEKKERSVENAVAIGILKALLVIILVAVGLVVAAALLIELRANL